MIMNHGHVRPNPDGSKARCGGPGLCQVCSAEAAQYIRPAVDASAVPENADPVSVDPLAEIGPQEQAQRRLEALLADPHPIVLDGDRKAMVITYLMEMLGGDPWQEAISAVELTAMFPPPGGRAMPGHIHTSEAFCTRACPAHQLYRHPGC